jgi:hypothetical protein
MRILVLSLGIALVTLATTTDAQVAMRSNARRHAPAQYDDYNSGPGEPIPASPYDTEYGGGQRADGGCGSGDCGIRPRDVGRCGDCGIKCGCALGTKTYIPYPRCFSFYSPCVVDGCCNSNPCCGTIFSEMYCDVRNWFGALAAIPSAECAAACPCQPIGFRSCSSFNCFRDFGCHPGFRFSMPRLCFQDLLAPPCVGGGGCGRKPGMLSGFAGILLQCAGRGNGCTSSFGCGGGCDGGCDGGRYDDGFGDGAYPDRTYRDGAYRDGADRDGADRDGAYRDGAYRDGAYRDGAYRDGAYRDGAYRDGAFQDGAYRDAAYRNGAYHDGPYHDGPYFDDAYGPTKDPGNSHRYYATTRPGSNRTEFVRAGEYRRIEAERVEGERMMARRETMETEPRAQTPEENQPRSARRATKPQAQNTSPRRKTERSVERVSFDAPASTLKLNGPRLDKADAETAPFLEFLDKQYRD